MNRPARLQRLDDEEDEEAVNHRNGGNRGGRGMPPSGPNWGNWFTAAVGVGAAALGAYGLYKASSLNNEEDIPNLVQDQEQLRKKLKKIKDSSYPVVGFNCQWTNLQIGGSRSPVKLIQIASAEGDILLIQMEKFPQIPKELIQFLGDPSIVKAGIEPDRDAKYLFEDYGLGVYSTYDLRFLAEDVGHRPEGLRNLAGKILDRDIGDPILDWHHIDEARIRYAETSVTAAIDLFKTLYSFLGKQPTRNGILDYCYEKLNKKYVFLSQKFPLTNVD